MIPSEIFRSAKARIHRGKLGGVGGHRLFEDLAHENERGVESLLFVT